MVPEFRMNAGFQHMVARHLAEFDSQKHDATGLKRAAVAITIVSDSDGRASFVLTKRATNHAEAPRRTMGIARRADRCQ